MADGDNDNSGELSSFLHLTGWRPLILALVAGLAGAFGLFGALSQPAEFQARYILFADRVASDEFTPAELDIFVEEIAQLAKLPVVINEVQETTGLIEEDDYTITVNQSGSSVANIDINVVTENANDARTIAIETGIEALTVALEGTLDSLVSAEEQAQGALDVEDAAIAQLTRDAGGINPTVAYDLATAAVVTRREFLINRPTVDVVDEDGNITTQLVPEPLPSLEVLEEQAGLLEPIDREYRQRVGVIDALNIRLADRQNDIRDANAGLALVATEREQSVVISEVVTEETSKIAGLLSGLLLYAVPVALLMILLFTIWDLFQKVPDAPLHQAEDFGAAGVLEAQGTRALPEANFTPLVLASEEEDDGNADAASHDDDSTSKNRRSKDGRWGPDAGSKAG